MDDLQAVGWLHRRAGFGLHPDELLTAAQAGPDAVLDDLTASLADGGRQSDPWAGLDLDPENEGRREAIVGWIRHIFESPDPFVDRRTWLLHGWFVSSFNKVPLPIAMVEQIRMLMRLGGDSMRELLRAVTIDRAMLFFLDGHLSTGNEPNENYGRELLELFALGVGNYTEDDVKAAAAALTGWVVTRESYDARFIPRRHDDTPVTLLGVDGVHDVDTVVDAVVAHEAHPQFVAAKVVEHYLGDADDNVLDGVVDELADLYVANEMRLDPVIVAALRLGLEGTSTPIVAAPVPWLVAAARAVGISANEALSSAQRHLRNLGQVPLLPPNVAGWPDGEEWFTTSSMIARINIADALAAEASPAQPLVIALADDDFDLAAQLMGLAEPFHPSTRAALRSAPTPENRLTVALVSPENLLT